MTVLTAGDGSLIDVVAGSLATPVGSVVLPSAGFSSAFGGSTGTMSVTGRGLVSLLLSGPDGLGLISSTLVTHLLVYSLP